MTDQELRQAARYDEKAAGYARYWAPVLAPSTTAVLERLDGVVQAGAGSVIDIGVGTGNLALAALERWPGVRVTGIDASSEMIEAARVLAGDLPDGAGERFEARASFAAELPFEDGVFDAGMSSFVLQLVPSRPKALREIRRVLRPGGTFSYVSWLTDRTPFAPDRVFDALLVETGFEEESLEDARPGDIPSVAVAAAELRRAGFRAVAAEGALLSHAFTVASYLEFLTEYDEVSLFEDEMTRSERRRFLITLRERLMALSDDDLVFRAPIVYASGIRSDG
jgi:SAM-dependent methyltransferase